ncbi:FtsX-like permease family protein [Phytomonospora sp. NPDC050363]|uniref:ABC transporter permease n=1 Tax=Phytomonospora sp. NPDC050363 TaxID=3155642 RepID=UPI0033FDE934
MSAVGRVMRVGVSRRRTQTIVIGLATLMAVTASVLGGGLIVVSGAPFDDAFTAQNGAHLAAAFDPAVVAPDDLAASARAEGVTATAGPFPVVTVVSEENGRPNPPLTFAGRDDPDSAVDAVTLIEGEWPDAPGELALAAGDVFLPLGERLDFPALPGSPTLTVVGHARSSTDTAEGWVTEDQANTLKGTGAPDGQQMFYRFASAGTATAMETATASVAATLPADAMTGSRSWLDVRRLVERETAVYVPFLMAFGVLGLVMSVLIVGNVVAGAVGSGTRRIGVLKAIGFTPAQVVRAHVGQALIPAAAGTVLGVLTGHLLAVPILAETSDAYGAGALTVPLWIDAVVVAGVLGLVAATALAAAWRAGRLRTVDALAVGRTPSAERGRAAARIAGGLPLPRALTLGLARPFARPVRTLAMVAAIVFGATAVSFAVGLSSSLDVILSARDHDVADVTVRPEPPSTGPGGRPDGPPPDLPDDTSAITAAIDAQPGTKAFYVVREAPAVVAGTTEDTELIAFAGDASWGGYTMIDGDWIGGPGEAVVPTGFLRTTGAEIGDMITVTVEGGRTTLRIVGEIFDLKNDGMKVYTDGAGLTLPMKNASVAVAVEPGTDLAAYTAELGRALKPLGAGAEEFQEGGSEMITILNSLTAALTLLLVAVAGLGVLNGVLLDTRERVRDMGVQKALGMTPGQTISGVLTSVTLVGIVGGLLGVPAGMALHNAVVPAMGDSTGIRLPQAALEVFTPSAVAALGLGGLAIALAGAMLPALWAARTRTTTALRTE